MRVHWFRLRHNDIRLTSVKAVAVQSDINNCKIRMTFSNCDVFAEEIRTGYHHEIAVSKGISGEIDIPVAVGFFVEIEMEHFHIMSSVIMLFYVQNID